MNESDLSKLRKEYIRLVDEKERLKKYKKELLKLEKNKKVKRYLELMDLVDIDYKEPKEEDLVIKAYNSSCIQKLPINSNQIMVYVGTYILDRTMHEFNDSITFENDPNADYKAYLDLETMEAYNITLDKCEEFESEHLTIYPFVPFNDSNEYMKKYFEFQSWFLKQLMTYSQKQVIEKIQTQECNKTYQIK